MRCEETTEFVSALCDGERIPREAAEHVGQCEKCRALLHDYIFAGAELRRAASLDPAENLPGVERLLAKAPAKTNQQKSLTSWWKKGAEAMKIPRFAFISMILLIVGLSSGLVVVKARSTTQVPAVLLSLKVPNTDSPWQCILSANGDPKTDSCSGLMQTKDGGEFEGDIQFVAEQGDQITVDVRSQFLPAPTNGASAEGVRNLPAQRYVLQLGQAVKIEIPGLGQAELTSQALDHIPAFSFAPKETLDPGQDELRMISPLLLRGNEAIIDMKGSSALGTGKDGVVWIYKPGVGRLIVSVENFQSAVKGQVNQSRISFELDGARYQLLTGAPITRAQAVWVAFDPNYQPGNSAMARTVLGYSTLPYLLGKNQ